MSSFSSDPSTLPSRISPWLMLPPSISAGNMFYNFYSLAENKTLTYRKQAAGGGEEVPGNAAELMGSSHGWLASYNSRSRRLYLSNPLSDRHIKFPPIPELNPTRGRGGGYFGCLERVVISCSPDDENCRAVMTYGPMNKLAFCCPGRSSDWTPIGGDGFLNHENLGRVPNFYESLVYSSRQKLFLCLTKLVHVEAWDLRDPNRPIMTRRVLNFDFDPKTFPHAARSVQEMYLRKSSLPEKALVVGEPDSGELFLVRRHVRGAVASGVSMSDVLIKRERSHPYMTIGVDVHKIDLEKRSLTYMDRTLNGLSFFVGKNHSFAVRPTESEFPELKANCIYFTDVYPVHERYDFGGHDIGVFNYEDESFSPCYYPCEVQRFRRVIPIPGHIKKIKPAPMWFTPTPL